MKFSYLPSSSPYKERSKFPEGLKETEGANCPLCRVKWEIGKLGIKAEKGLNEIHWDEEGMFMMCLREGERGSKGLMAVAMDCVIFMVKMQLL